ncbi:ParA family protein [Chryseobacterium lactis]|uniref:ParA family protein n=3 Tax=Chryseobacterium TaxID=59732 RepID=A0A3G6RKY6_CHRLC|nr:MULTISPECIES: ParA family protein [Bacteroidota]AZA84540.1 ParA family protein [Chryseobacterium lactis]AZB04928.1 ParA family protein [Chryseobacterium lactis]KMQ64407.1 conjugal transfer protein TraA [Chryseobacterium angstadtii]MBF6643655.1 ParA family protein [Chryseobacterium indologenes]PNW14659.1 ParA family protein [Chryseobacterium lactis]
MEKKKKTLFVAFSSQKGGVGKSTFTAILASTLHYSRGLNVAVFDCDYPQHSLAQMRQRDQSAIMKNETFKKLAFQQFKTINKKAYPIFQCKPELALKEAEQFLKLSPIPVDIIFFDLPGTVNTPGLLSTLAGMNHIFSPITADRVVLESTLSFTDVMTNVLIKNGETSIETIRLFWNQVDGRERSVLYNHYDKIIHELGLTLMETRVTDSKRFRKESESEAKTVFRSTLLPPDRRLVRSCKMDMFIEEFLKTIKLKDNG